ncbi:phosphoserine phosphatase SerB [Cumulibacter soli]|uniref:phosphoserine phosphatase SerB n=1 Tax=Cumulibacter soli TaxID=2546344 RepID=UPI001067AD54|nr:phosphoserine phosphatase SerB [Cumulibacter soli]
MTCYAVLLAESLEQPALIAAERAIDLAGGEIAALRTLSDSPAALEMRIEGMDAADARRELRTVLDGVDVCVEATTDGQRPARRLLLMDVDSTLVAGEVIDSLAAHVGKGEQVAAVTERAMRGELDFRESLHERVATLAGLPTAVLDEVRASLRLSDGARTLIATLQDRGALIGAVSGGFTQILDPLADDIGLDFAAANTLEVRDGHLTGRVTGRIVDRAEKARNLRVLAERNGIVVPETVAIGDGANDLDMIAAAGIGIAFNAKPIVQLEAPATLNTPRLSDALLLLGIQRDEFLSE